LTSAYQNDLKTQKNINLKKKIKKIYFFSKTLLKRKNKQGLNANLFFFWIFFLRKPTGLAGLKKIKEKFN
jgi:hypothetical protein